MIYFIYGTLNDSLENVKWNSINNKINYNESVDDAGCDSLEDFVLKTNRATANSIIPSMGRFADRAGWGPNGYKDWYRFMILYQNVYNETSQYDVIGQGLFFGANNKVYLVFISGNHTQGLTYTHREI